MPFEKGKSGNPGGRPKENAEIKALARTFCKKSIEVLAKLLESRDEKSRIAAANALLDRGIGKPTQPIAGDDEFDPIDFRDAADKASRIVGSFLELAANSRDGGDKGEESVVGEGEKA